MRLPIDDPESLEDFGAPVYSVDQFRDEIRKLQRREALMRNLVRLAETLSTEPRVKKTLKEALDVTETRS